MTFCVTHAALTLGIAQAEEHAAKAHNDIDLPGLERAKADIVAREARISRARHVMTCETCLDATRESARAEIFGAKAS